MGCGVISRSVGTTRFTNPDKFNLDGLRFDNPPPPVVATQGLHPAARRLETKRGPATAIKTNEGGVLVYLSDTTMIECLFVYPEYNATQGKPPAKCFGKPLAEVQVESQNGTKVSFLQQMKTKTTEVVTSMVVSIQRSISNVLGGLLMSDADEDLKAPPKTADPHGEYGDSGLPPGAPNWIGAICQIKEYDDSTDVFKPWFRDAGGGVPGLLRLETAGPAGAWATLQPHVYQQRWVLPNERRCNSFADEELSIPQRLQRAYATLGGEKWLKEICTALESARKSLEPEILMAAFDTAELATILSPHPEDSEARAARDMLAKTTQGVFHDVPKLIEKLIPLLTEEAVKNLYSVYQFPDELYQIQLMLAYIENAMLYNWFSVTVVAELEVGTAYYMKNDPSGKGTTESSLRDLLVRGILSKSEKLAEDVFQEAKEALGQVVRLALLKVLCPKDAGLTEKAKAQLHAKALFPDMEDIVREDAECLDMEMEGLEPKFKESDPAFRNPQQVDELLKRWEQEDARPLAERRAEHYKNVTEGLVKAAQEAGLDFEKVNKVADTARFPYMMPRHFYDFDFLLVFPKQGSDGNLSKRPSVAELNLWPDSHLTARRTILMKDLYIPNGGPQEVGKLANKAADLFDSETGNTGANDPRAKWGPYPNKEWRGFQCTVRVATDLIYNYNFNLDGHVFLDDNSFVTHPEKEYYRRIRFRPSSGPYTYNPLEDMGLVAM